jgi:hypothetical protein
LLAPDCSASARGGAGCGTPRPGGRDDGERRRARIGAYRAGAGRGAPGVYRVADRGLSAKKPGGGGAGEPGSRGDGEPGSRGDGETGRRGDGEPGRRGDGETGRRGDRETGRQGDRDKSSG